jgi:hypothetical protein
MFTLRRMRPDDKPRLMEIASRIWDGTDYLPRVFDEWVEDATGEFTAVLLDGRVVGCGKLTFCTDTDAWLEGLRKDPLVKERGLARAVVLHQLELLARVNGAGPARNATDSTVRSAVTSVRFSTHVTNVESIAVNEGVGFRRRAALSLKWWDGSASDRGAFPPRAGGASRRDVREVRDEVLVYRYMEGSEYLAAATGLIVDGWHCLPFSLDCVSSRYVRPGGACRGVFHGRDLAGLSICTIRGTMATIAFLDAVDEESAGALLDDIVLRLRAAASAAAPGVTASPCEIEWMVPDLPRLKKWCTAWGLVSEVQEDDFLVYELPLEALARFAP